MRYPLKGCCTHQFPDVKDSPEWNGCGNEGIYVEACEGVPQYRCSDHIAEWFKEQLDYALTEHKKLSAFVARTRADDLPPEILDRIEKDECA